MESKIEKLLIGEPLKTEELKGEKFSVFWGLPILSSDAISSVAYAGDEILYVLVFTIGMAAYKNMLYVVMCIVFLLFLLVFSYRQTIDNYPQGGGSYIVSKDNLGTLPSLTAAASLSIDYVLTVAVSVSAGTAAITSAFPSLLEFTVPIAIIIVFILTIGNLRGIKDSSRLFGIPAYMFILIMGSLIVTGIVKHALGMVPSHIPVVPPATEGLSVFLFLKAFSGGCTALTGIEAVSDGIPNFKEPSQKNAKKVLMLLATIVLFIFGGISYLSTIYHAVPNPDVTVIAQISTQVFGKGNVMFYAVQIITSVLLVMAANTAYADFPLLLSIISKDGFAPRQLSKRGKRLSFSNGIILLATGAIALIIIFQGTTHFLLPLYAVGVFISFTLSQAGMFKRWIRLKNPGWKHKAMINGFGAFVTFCTVLIIAYEKFTKGAWLVLILIPSLVFIMLRIRSHYNRVADQLKLTVNEKPKDITYIKQKQYVIVPIDTLNKSFLKALNYARTISDNIIVFHISVDEDATEKLKKKWIEYSVGIPLVIKNSPYRDVLHILYDYIDSEEYAAGPNDMVTVVIPQFVITKWWHKILHNQTSWFLKSMLMKRRNIAVITVPYIIEE